MISYILPANKTEKTVLQNLEEHIARFSNFIIFTHKNPDGDAIGSALAMKKILELKNKKAEIFIFDSIGKQFFFFPGIQKIKILRELKEINDAVFIFIDCSTPARTGFDFSFSKSEKNIIIDHHPDAKLDAPNSISIIDPQASSTTEIIFDLTEKLRWKRDRDISFCLAAGILSDTGTFQHANTSSKALRAISTLIKSGVNLKKIAENLFQKREVESSLKIWGKILAETSLDKDTKMAYSFVTQDDIKRYNTTDEELNGLANLLSGIPESKFSLLLSETKFGKIKASLRSESYKGIDVSKIAQAFGGGGHKLAAGFEIKGKIEKQTIESIKEKIKEELKKQ